MIGLEIGLGVAMIILLALLFLLFAPFVAVSYFLLAKAGLTVIIIVAAAFFAVVAALVVSFFNVYTQSVWLSFFSIISMEKISDSDLKLDVIENKVPNPEAA